MITKLDRLGVRMTRVLSNNIGDYMQIKIQDENSRVCLASIEMSLEQFAACITGLQLDDCKGETAVKDSRLNKIRVSAPKQVEVPDLGYSNEPYIEWFYNWSKDYVGELQIVPGSRDFVRNVDGKKLLTYYIITYEDHPEEQLRNLKP